MRYLNAIKREILCAAMVLFLFSLSGQAVGATTESLTVNAVIPDAPPCQVKVDPPTITSADWSIKSGDIPNGKNISASRTLSISLTQCGPGSAGKMPTIRLSSTDLETEVLPQANSSYLLRNAGSSTSDGYWFVIMKKSNGGFNSTDLYLLDPASTDRDIVLSTTKGLSGAGLTKDIFVGVTCATKTVSALTTAPCNSSAGTLNATLNIEFIYK